MSKKKFNSISLQEFLEGDPLPYLGFAKKPMVATYRVGVGVLVQTPDGNPLCESSEVASDKAAKRLYYNLTRRAL